MSCRLSARGHRWREPKLAARTLRPNPALRVCECGATGYVNKQGVVVLDWEPPCGKLAISHPCDRADVRAIVLELGELEIAHRAGDVGAHEYIGQRGTLVGRLMETLG